MGTYVYKLTNEKVKLSDGTVAYSLAYAYKPTFRDLKLDRDMHKTSGAKQADTTFKRLSKNGGQIKGQMHGHVVTLMEGSCYDDWFFNQPNEIADVFL